MEKQQEAKKAEKIQIKRSAAHQEEIRPVTPFKRSKKEVWQKKHWTKEG